MTAPTNILQVSERLGDTRDFREEGPTLMKSTVMPMPMRLTGSVAPDARVRVPWQCAVAPVSAGFGLGFGSPSYVTSGTDHNQATEITTKAHGARRLPETST